MFTIYVILATIFLPSIRCVNNTEPNNAVVILDENSIHDAVNDNDFIFINFYASWCWYSILAAPKFKKAAERASVINLPVVFAKMESSNISEEFDITSYPTFKLYRIGRPIQYYGERKPEHFIRWLQTYIKPIKTLNTIEETKVLIESENVTVIGFFKDNKSEEARKYKEIALALHKPMFTITQNDEIFNAFNTTDGSIILHNKLDDNTTTLFTENLTLHNMMDFCNIYSKPLIEEINKDTIDDIFEQSNIHKYVIILVSKNDTNKTDLVLQSAKIVAKEYRNQVRFVLVDVDKDYLLPILTRYYVSFDEIPGLLLIPDVFKITSYKMSGNLSLKNIRYFVKYFEDNKLDDLIGEKLPQDWNAKPVYTLVKSNFFNVTHDFEKDVLVYMYVDNCKKCLPWIDVIENVATTLAAQKDVIVSKINIGFNSIGDQWYAGVPSVVLFRKGDNVFVRYEGSANAEDLIKFVSENVDKKEE